MEVPVKSIIFIFIIIIIVILTVIITIIITVIYFHCNTRNRFYESLSIWKTFIDPNSDNDFIYVLQTLEMINVDLELDCLQLFKTNFDN